MVKVIEQILQDFKSDHNMNSTFVMETKNVGFLNVMGKIYTLIWLSEPRLEDIERMIRLHGTVNIILFCKVIYSTSRALLELEGISYLEWKGRTFFVDAPPAANELNKNKENYFDQRVNDSRINSWNGSAILLALKKHPELLKLPVKELAKRFNIAEKTMYYYLSQFRKAGYLVKDTRGNEIVNKKMFDKNKLFGNLDARGWHQLKANHRINCVFPNMRKCRYWKKKEFRCVFVDELEPCENMCARIEREIEKGVYVFISPYNKELIPDFDKTFRADFRAWYAKRQFERWASM